jgi:hypothetical protein
MKVDSNASCEERTTASIDVLMFRNLTKSASTTVMFKLDEFVALSILGI